MAQARIPTVLVSVAMLLATACDGRAPTSATSPAESPLSPPTTPSPPTPSPDPGATPPRQSMAFEMTGTVTDDEGRPVAGAKVTIILDYSESYGAEPWVLTDQAGRYTVKFIGVPGSNRGPAGTEESMAFAQVEVSGYGRLARYLLGTTRDLVENFRVHLIKRITAGESALLTIAPDDGVCAIDTLPDRDFICATALRVVAPRDGIMRVEAVPTQAGSALPMLEVWGGQTGAPRTQPGSPTALRVTAGTQYTVDVAVPWGINARQSFIVKTSM